MVYAKLAGLVLLILQPLKLVEAEVQYLLRYRDPENEHSTYRTFRKPKTQRRRRAQVGMHVRGDGGRSGGTSGTSNSKFSKAKSAESRLALEDVPDQDDDYYYGKGKVTRQAPLVFDNKNDLTQTSSSKTSSSPSPSPFTLLAVEPPYPLTGDDLAAAPTPLPTIFDIGGLSSLTPTNSVVLTQLSTDDNVFASNGDDEEESITMEVAVPLEDDSWTPSNDDPSVVNSGTPSNDDPPFVYRSNAP